MSKYIDLKENVSKNVEKNYDAWENIVYGFTNWILQLFTQDDMKNDSSDQQTDILDTPEQTKFGDFLEQIKEQKNIDMRLSSKYFPYEWPDEMLQTLYVSKSKADNYSKFDLW